MWGLQFVLEDGELRVSCAAADGCRLIGQAAVTTNDDQYKYKAYTQFSIPLVAMVVGKETSSTVRMMCSQAYICDCDAEPRQWIPGDLGFGLATSCLSWCFWESKSEPHRYQPVLHTIAKDVPYTLDILTELVQCIAEVRYAHQPDPCLKL